MLLLGGLIATSPAKAAPEWASRIINPYVGQSMMSRQEQRERAPAPISLDSISCASRTFCAAVGGQLERREEGRKRKEYERGYLLTFNGRRWSWPLRAQGKLELSAVSCPSSSFCAAVGNRITGPNTFAGYSLIYNGHSWSEPALRVRGKIQRGTRNAELEMISCASRSFCVVTNNSGEVLRYNGRRWSEPVTSYPRGKLVSLACPAVSTCVALVDVYSREAEGAVFQEALALTFNGRAWSAPSALPGQVGPLSCPTASFCLALGSDAEGSFQLTYDGSSWSAAVAITGGLSGPLSCASPSFCVDVDEPEFVRTFNGSSWSPPVHVGGLELSPGVWAVAISCPSAAFCLALGQGGGALYYPARVAPRPSERRATLSVSPARARRGGRVRVFGSVGRFNGRLDCPAGERLELSSEAFGPTSRDAVYGKVEPNGAFSARATIPSSTQPGLYTVSGRCLTGELGVTVQLEALP